MKSDEATTAERLKKEFQSVVDLLEVPNVADKAPGEILKLLPKFDQNADNPAYGILLIEGKAYALQSGINLAREMRGGITFQRGSLRNTRILETTSDFFRLEAHIEAQVAAFMRKHGFKNGELVLNVAPCDRAGLGCRHRLPAMLEEGSILKVHWPVPKGVKAQEFAGLPD
jgi:hypothetical protein